MKTVLNINEGGRMKKFMLGIMTNILFIVLITPYCNAAEAIQNGCVITKPDRKAIKAKKRVKAQKIDKIGKVVDINGSNITYAFGEGKEEKVIADTFPGSLKVGDKIHVKTENGRVTIVKQRIPMKIPIE